MSLRPAGPRNPLLPQPAMLERHWLARLQEEATVEVEELGFAMWKPGLNVCRK
eukprot:CAMPEP_0179115286 /NCGR_PEP_ID=MMETSP0796-20121207/54022_1 /TAXON_ID=73915 /ORGANISM="Pyrodinium bahamense, Strain pbaha01" /LENGTH=52 /DNA_ID=CAMNT_0020813533 /DNA_START=124 /DNA_END=279 /DNA_ORIENTATION=-